MSPLVFLGVAVVVFALLALGSWLAQRERRSTFDSSIKQHQHEMNALAPDWHRDQAERK